MADQPKKLIQCPNCDGCGKVDSRDKKSWRRFSGMSNDHPDMKHILGATGEIVPEICPVCKGRRVLEADSAEAAPVVTPAKPFVPVINTNAPGQLLAAARGEYGEYAGTETASKPNE